MKFSGWRGLALLLGAGGLLGATTTPPWMSSALDPDQRAGLLLQQMTVDERIGLLHGHMAMPFGAIRVPEGAIGSAGYVPGIPRLGIPALQESDAGLGVADLMGQHAAEGATAMPSTMAQAASFDPGLAEQLGAAIGNEAWSKGFNVMLAGGINLAREPRNGRNFEYFGEDPLLAGLMAGAAISGIQSQHVVSTTKHFALNAQESQRHTLNAVIDEAALRESDLLAFQIAIERGRPGAVMCAFNAVNGSRSCNNDMLLNQVLKRDWSYPGWVMSDWGAVDSVDSAGNGLDQQSAAELDWQRWFKHPLQDALISGRISHARVDDMARRILRSMFAHGLFDHPPVKRTYDTEAHAALAQRATEAGIVLLKNRTQLLPLSTAIRSIAVIGGYADLGVMSGGGTSQVLPPAASGPTRFRVSGEGLLAAYRIATLHPSPPVTAIRAAVPQARVTYDNGMHPEAAARLAAASDIAIVFATQWMVEAYDAPSLSLPNGQDPLIEAVAAANPNTIVVLETGGAVLMPWLPRVGAVLEAWYPGIRGGQAIANVLFGKVNPSGRLPITFPAAESQLPHPLVPGIDLPEGSAITIDYNKEGSDVGYRWYARHGHTPLFPFGHGLSYTSFSYGGLQLRGGDSLTLSFDVTNRGQRHGADVPQAYLTAQAGKPLLRLIGFSRVELAPGETRRVTLSVDPRLLASYDVARKGWHVPAGEYRVAIGASAADRAMEDSVKLRERRLKP